MEKRRIWARWVEQGNLPITDRVGQLAVWFDGETIRLGIVGLTGTWSRYTAGRTGSSQRAHTQS